MIHIFYHKRDLDGHCSGAIARYALEKQGHEVKMWGYDYGEPFPFDKIMDGEQVYMVDITTNPYEVMIEVQKRYDLFVIDHHKSFINSDSSVGITGLFVDGVAACQLSWHHFFVNETTPELIRLLGEYDVWHNSDKDQWENRIMPFQMGTRMKHTDPATNVGYDFWYAYIASALGKSHHHQEIEMGIWESGNTIMAYQKMEDSKATALYSYEAEFEGLKAICLNNTRFNSQVYESVWDNTKHDIMLAWVNVKGEYCSVSLYTDKEGIDVSQIAKEFGGGGHLQAAGFQCKNVTVQTSMTNQKTIVIDRL